jgi:hypothetical protein
VSRALSVDDLVARACEETGLSDFGPFAWRDGLEALFESAASEADLNEVGLGVFASWVHRRLVNRLRVFDWVARHPELREERVERPLFVLGMLRTGTTHLSELLARDPRSRPLMKWEGLSSVPPPERATFATDPRIERTVGEVEFQYRIVPRLRAVHYEPGDGPTECVALLTQSFRAQDFFGLFRVPRYVAWYRGCDFRPAYDYHLLCLQLLQSRAPGRWSLKAPGHMHALDALLAVYPDAQLIVTHRDPLEVVPSAASLSVTSRPDSLTRARDREGVRRYYGRLWLEELGLMTDRLLAFRERQPGAAVHDVAYRDLVCDPLGVVRAAYARFGETLSGEAEAAMAAHLAASPKGRHGRHDYDLADFGLAPEEVRERFQRYTERFGPAAAGVP